MHEHHHQVDDDGDRLDEDVQDVHGLDDQDDMTGSHMQHEMSAGLDGEDDQDEGTPMDGDGMSLPLRARRRAHRFWRHLQGIAACER